MDDKTCEQCGGTGKFPLINVWEVKRRLGSGEDPGAIPLFPNAPCAECQNENFVAYTQAMIERHGEPFPDGDVTSVVYYISPEGERYAMLSSKEIHNETQD